MRIEEDTPARVSITFSCRTRLTPFVLERRMTLNAGSPVLVLDETAHNLGRRGIDIMWGHHPAFGAPFLSRDCRLYANARTLNVNLKHRTTWPVGEFEGKHEDFSRPPAPRSGLGRMLYLEDLIEGWYALVNPKLKIGFGMRWNKRQFPVVWIWQEAGASKGSPWFGNAYATAVEPFTNLPLARERKEKLLRVPAGKTVTARFEAFALPGGKPVRSGAELRRMLS